MSNLLEEKFVAMAAEEIRKEIDWEIISTMLISSGWTKVRLPGRQSDGTETKMANWCKAHITGKIRHTPNEFIFEHEKDATLFVLRWADGQS